MSKAFTKEDEGPGAAVIVPALMPLPEGMPNYVTERGLEQLRNDLTDTRRSIEQGRRDSSPDPSRLAALHERARQLEARVAEARLVNDVPSNPEEIRFGAEVHVRYADGRETTLRIVGVDEADAGSGRVAFVAPLARALLGATVDDEVTVNTPRGRELLEIIEVRYPDSHNPQ